MSVDRGCGESVALECEALSDWPQTPHSARCSLVRCVCLHVSLSPQDASRQPHCWLAARRLQRCCPCGGLDVAGGRTEHRRAARRRPAAVRRPCTSDHLYSRSAGLCAPLPLSCLVGACRGLSVFPWPDASCPHPHPHLAPFCSARKPAVRPSSRTRTPHVHTATLPSTGLDMCTCSQPNLSTTHRAPLTLRAPHCCFQSSNRPPRSEKCSTLLQRASSNSGGSRDLRSHWYGQGVCTHRTARTRRRLQPHGQTI